MEGWKARYLSKKADPGNTQSIDKIVETHHLLLTSFHPAILHFYVVTITSGRPCSCWKLRLRSAGSHIGKKAFDKPYGFLGSLAWSGAESGVNYCHTAVRLCHRGGDSLANMTAWSLLTPYMTTAVAAMKGHMGLTICESRVNHVGGGSQEVES